MQPNRESYSDYQERASKKYFDQIRTTYHTDFLSVWGHCMLLRDTSYEIVK